MTHRKLTILGALLLSSVSGAAFAQTDAKAPDTKAPVAELEQIVVQARRTDESLQRVPVAVTALSSQSLERAGIESPQDLNIKVPSLTVSPAQSRRTAATFGIRGQRNIQVRLGTDSSVAVYFNEVVMARPYGVNQGLYDMQSVQVLKGPQGTLFGRNTTGGAILFQPKRPTGNFDALIEGELGNYNHRVITGMINVPVNDALSIRVAGTVKKRDGFTTNVIDGKKYDDDDNYSYRVGVLFRPNDKFETYTLLDVFKSDTNASSNLIWGVTAANVAPLPGLLTQLQTALAAQRARPADQTAMDVGAATISRVDHKGLANTTTYQLTDSIKIKNVIAGRELHTLDQFDLDGSPVQLLQVGGDIDINQLSEEFQVQGNLLDGNLDYILGAFYFREDGTDINFNVRPLGFRPDVVTGNPFTSGGYLSSVSKSIFGQANYKFANVEGLSATVGIRKTWDERSVDVRGIQYRAGTPFAFCRFNNTAANTNPSCPGGTNQRDFAAVTWTAGLQYEFGRNLVYGKVSRGYRSGGFDPSASITSTIVGFEPEILTETEVGYKTEFHVAEMPARLNTAAYYSKGDNIQRTVRLDQQSTATTTINAGKATFWGVELEGTIVPLPGFEISGFYNYNSAKYDTFRDGAGVDQSSNYFTFLPKQKYGVSATYSRELDNIGKFSAFATYAHQSKIYFDDLNVTAGIADASQTPGYGLLNLGASLEDIGARPVNASVWVRNATDEVYANGGGTVLGATAVNLGEPRMYGVTVSYRFGASAR